MIVVYVLGGWLAVSMLTLIAWNVVKAAVAHRTVRTEA